jgi:hypothetical protein
LAVFAFSQPSAIVLAVVIPVVFILNCGAAASDNVRDAVQLIL